ncbi:MAG TPA: SDR family oxidoreductase [Gammaproteobacteria bacterium]|nr:SDR family oxidoreductase [Gammaproteobacteria bacterium]
MARLAGKIAIVTGAAAGIGLASARLFVAEGAKVLLVDIQRAELEAAAAELGEAQAMAMVADVSDPAQTQAYVDAALARWGRIDVLFANAGIEGKVAPIVDVALEDYERVMAVNVRGVLLALKAVLPVMQKQGGGSIVITSSLGGLRGTPRIGPYIASKHAVVGLMKTAALENARYNVRVNTVNPAPIDTRMVHSLEQQWAPGAPEKMSARMVNGVPLQRYGTPAEVAQLALFLASDESSFCTGNAFSIDGGMSAS